MVRSFRCKPVGWRGESYRHYLARKGISTRYFATIPNDAAKGNREEGGIKAAQAKGYSKEEVRNDPALQVRFGVNPEDLILKTKVSPAPFVRADVPSAGVSPVYVPPPAGPVESLSEEPIPEEERPWKKKETNISPGISPYTGFDYERGPI